MQGGVLVLGQHCRLADILCGPGTGVCNLSEQHLPAEHHAHHSVGRLCCPCASAAFSSPSNKTDAGMDTLITSLVKCFCGITLAKSKALYSSLTQAAAAYCTRWHNHLKTCKLMFSNQSSSALQLHFPVMHLCLKIVYTKHNLTL